MFRRQGLGHGGFRLTFSRRHGCSRLIHLIVRGGADKGRVSSRSPLVHSNAHTACKTHRNQLTEKGLLHDVTAPSDVDNFVRVHPFHLICMFAQTRQALL